MNGDGGGPGGGFGGRRTLLPLMDSAPLERESEVRRVCLTPSHAPGLVPRSFSSLPVVVMSIVTSIVSTEYCTNVAPVAAAVSVPTAAKSAVAVFSRRMEVSDVSPLSSVVTRRVAVDAVSLRCWGCRRGNAWGAERTIFGGWGCGMGTVSDDWAGSSRCTHAGSHRSQLPLQLRSQPPQPCSHPPSHGGCSGAVCASRLPPSCTP